MSAFTISRAILAHFGSLRTTLVCMAMLAATVAAGQVQGQIANGALGAVLAALGLNLLAALGVHPAFRRQLPLLVFDSTGWPLRVDSGCGL
jgi:hypothetical protein